MKEIEIIVTGRVQFVMFRDFATRKARRLGLKGFVQNRNDWSVYLRAQGDELLLKNYIEKLHMGSFLSRVDQVEVVWKEPQGDLKRFYIKYD